ncbi:hypothetical protein WJX82_005006 [Trebouxia sp. C0006]
MQWGIDLEWIPKCTSTCATEALSGQQQTVSWQSSDTACGLSSQYRISGAALLAANRLIDFSSIAAGTSVTVPSEVPAMACPLIAVAGSGDSLYGIWQSATSANLTTATFQEMLTANPQTYKNNQPSVICGDQVMVPCSGSHCACSAASDVASTTPIQTPLAPLNPSPQITIGPNPGPTNTPQPTESGYGQMLTIAGNQLLMNGLPIRLRGANLMDVNACGSCTTEPDLSVPESLVAAAISRMDALVNIWGANFIRLCLESPLKISPDGTKAYQDIANLGNDYFQSVLNLVTHAASYSAPVIVEVSIQFDHTIDQGSMAESTNAQKHGLPSFANNAAWAVLVPLLESQQHVIFGVCNEPFKNDGAIPAAFAAMQSAVQYIRNQETGSSHIISVSGLNGWAADLSYYVQNRILLANGQEDLSIVYETHCYGCDLSSQVLVPFADGNLPVIIGEIGPANGVDTDARAASAAIVQLQQADYYGIPFAWWSFTWDCAPSALQTPGQSSCGGSGPNPTFSPSAVWGQKVLSFMESSSS